PRRGRAARRLAAGQRARDVVYLRNGDVVEGTVTSADKDAFKVEVEKKEVQVNRVRVAAVAFNTELLTRALPKGPYGHLVLTGGGRLAVASARAGRDGTLRGRTPLGAAFEVPLADVAALDLRQGRAVYLSDLKPARYEH